MAVNQTEYFGAYRTQVDTKQTSGVALKGSDFFNVFLAAAGGLAATASVYNLLKKKNAKPNPTTGFGETNNTNNVNIFQINLGFGPEANGHTQGGPGGGGGGSEPPSPPGTGGSPGAHNPKANPINPGDLGLLNSASQGSGRRKPNSGALTGTIVRSGGPAGAAASLVKFTPAAPVAIAAEVVRKGAQVAATSVAARAVGSAEHQRSPRKAGTHALAA